MPATMNKALISKLPSKPSAMIRLALHDVAAVLKTRKAKINMDVWMQQRPPKTPRGKPGVCEVCFGGAVMLQTLKIDPLVHGYLVDCYDGLDLGSSYGSGGATMRCRPNRTLRSTVLADKITALDYFRVGLVLAGLSQMGVSERKQRAVEEAGLDQMSVPAFNHPRQFPAFRRAMQKMARALERHNL